MPQLLHTSTQLAQTYQAGAISIYSGELTKEGMVEAIKTIKSSFPTLPDSFYVILTDRVRDNGFSDQRLLDAVKHVIDNCVYPQPTIAQFISYDAKIKTYSYHEAFDNGAETLKPVRLPNRNKPVWVRFDDIEKYNLLLWE